MRILIGEPFKFRVYPLIFLNDKKTMGVVLKNGLAANLKDVFNGFQQLRPFKIYDFSNLGDLTYYHKFSLDFALLSDKVFLFEDLFAGKQNELFKIPIPFYECNYNLINDNGIICAFQYHIYLNDNTLPIPIPSKFNLFDRENNQYIKGVLPYLASKIIKVKKHHNGYLMLLLSEKRSQNKRFWILLTPQGNIVFLGDDLNQNLSNRSIDTMSDLQEFFSSPATDHDLHASAVLAFKNMELWNMNLYQSKQLVSEFGICIEQGKIEETAQYMKGILEGNPIENYFGLPLNECFYEFKK